MKTVEEKAEKYANKKYQDSNEWVACYFGYMAGYAEAMRWRDPNIELPDYYKMVIVKYERDDSNIDHEYVALLADDDGAYFFGNYRFDIIIDFDKVIGWRPTE